MQMIKGRILHKKSFTVKSGKNQGKQIPVISILDEYENYSQVIDITDFDNFVNGMPEGTDVLLPFKSRPGVSEKGNPYINYVTAGAPQEA